MIVFCLLGILRVLSTLKKAHRCGIGGGGGAAVSRSSSDKSRKNYTRVEKFHGGEIAIELTLRLYL